MGRVGEKIIIIKRKKNRESDSAWCIAKSRTRAKQLPQKLFTQRDEAESPGIWRSRSIMSGIRHRQPEKERGPRKADGPVECWLHAETLTVCISGQNLWVWKERPMCKWLNLYATLSNVFSLLERRRCASCNCYLTSSWSQSLVSRVLHFVYYITHLEWK